MLIGALLWDQRSPADQHMTLGQRGWMAALCAGALMVGWSSAMAEEFSSQYTSADVRKCRKIDSFKPGPGDFEFSIDWACRGAAGYVVLVRMHDERFAVSVGKTAKAAEAEPAATQGFGAFNFSYDTVEWRSRKGSDRPFAIIQRWTIFDSERPNRDGHPGRTGLLIVTRLPPGPVCHVAYVDVAANPDANILARQAAGEGARDFACQKD